MSTKIFDAYILPSGSCRSARSLLNVSHRIRSTLAPVSQQLAFSMMAERLAAVVDELTLGIRIGCDKSPRSLVREEEDQARENMRAGRRAVNWDFNLEWAFLVTPRGRIVIKLFGESALCSAFTRAFPQAADYHFQNSTDRPKEISAPAWSQRRRDWDRMVGSGSFCSRALTMKLWGDYDGPSMFDRERILKCFPGIRKRAESMASVIATREWASIREGNGEKFEATEFFRFLREYGDPINAELRSQLSRRIGASLIPRITHEQLSSPGASLNPSHVRRAQPGPVDYSLSSAAL